MLGEAICSHTHLYGVAAVCAKKCLRSLTCRSSATSRSAGDVTAAHWHSITGFDATPFPARVAGLAQRFDPAAFLDTRTIRRQDRVLHLAVSASDLAVRDAGLAPGSWDPRRSAVTVSSGKGGVAASEDAMRSFVEHGPAVVKPRRHDASFVPAAVGIRHYSRASASSACGAETQWMVDFTFRPSGALPPRVSGS